MASATPDRQNRPESMAVSKSQERSTGLNGNTATAGVCALLAVAVILVFGQTLRYGFVNYDDDLYFYSNKHVQGGLSGRGMAWAFSTGYNGNWHPLTWLSFMLDVELFGTEPVGPHLTNVLLHTANTVLLFLLLEKVTTARWRSALVAAGFGLHPLHVESVAWVSERKDVLSGLFFMLTLLLYARYAQKKPRTESRESTTQPGPTLETRPWTSDYYLALLFFALGLMSKPMLVTLPFVLLLLDWWPLQRVSGFKLNASNRRLVREKIPFFLLSAFICVATIYAQPQTGIRIGEKSLDLRIENAVATYFIYLEKAVYPSQLAVFYPYSPDGLSVGQAGVGIVLLAGVCLGFFYLRSVRPYLLTGWLWYLGMLVPVIGLMQFTRHARADHYTYLPIIGIFIVLVWGAGDLFPSWQYRRRALGVAATIVTAALMVCAAGQVSNWRNSESLWTHALACTTENYIGHNNLGLVRAAQGRFAEALQHFEKAVEINPAFAEAHNNLGVFLGQQGQMAEAIGHFQKAIEVQPDCTEAYNGLGNVLANLGRYTEAIEQYQQALKIKPDYAEAHYNLGNTLALQGRYAEAIEHFRKALQIEPDDVKAQLSLNAALELQRRPAEGTGKQTNP